MKTPLLALALALALPLPPALAQGGSGPICGFGRNDTVPPPPPPVKAADPQPDAGGGPGMRPTGLGSTPVTAGLSPTVPLTPLGAPASPWVLAWESEAPSLLPPVMSSAVSVGAEALLARGSASAPRPSKGALHRLGVRALETLARGGASGDVRASALLALGLALEGTGDADAVAIGWNTLREGDSRSQEAAALALGLLAADSDVDLLLGLVRGSAATADALGGVPTESVRAHAAYGLASLGARTHRAGTRRVVVEALVAAAEDKDHARLDLELAALEGLGHVAPDWVGTLPSSDAPWASDRAALVERLLDGLEKDGVRPFRTPRLAAAATLTIARLLDADARFPAHLARAEAARRAALLSFARRAEDRKTPSAVRAATLFGLGTAGGTTRTALDALCLGTLVRAARSPADAHVGRGALAGLGALAGHERSQVGAKAEAALAEAVERERDELAAWAALTLGKVAVRLDARGQTLDPETLAALRDAFADRRGPGESGAYALALALADDRASKSALRERLERIGGGQDEVRMHIATALGLLGDDADTPRLRALLGASANRPELFAEAAAGLARLADGSLQDRLHVAAEALARGARRASTARTLGRLIDPERLIELLSAANGSTATHRFAASALGAALAADPTGLGARFAAASEDRSPIGDWTTPLPQQRSDAHLVARQN